MVSNDIRYITFVELPYRLYGATELCDSSSCTTRPAYQVNPNTKKPTTDVPQQRSFVDNYILKQLGGEELAVWRLL